MAEDLLARLKAVDPATLTDVVRRDQHSPSFVITEWSVKRLSDKGVINPDGLWLFSGVGTDPEGSRNWSVVLKIFQPPEQEPPPTDIWYWKREIGLAHSGLKEHLPGPVKAPRFYKTEENTDGAWLWMEHIENRHTDPWVLEDYAFAAHQLGTWNGKYVTGTPLPDEPWLARQHYRSWLSGVNPEEDWQFPLHAKYISADLRKRYDQLYTEREMFFGALEALPQTFSHFDSQRRNLFIRKSVSEQDELVMVDWALCGLGPLGAELYALVGMSCLLFEWPASAISQLDKAAFNSYLQGLRQAGWSGEADLVRLGYKAWMAVWNGVIYPYALKSWCSPENREFSLQQFGQAEDELYLTWLPLFSFFLDCADDARALMKQTGMA